MILRVDNVTKKYGKDRVILSNINLQFEQGHSYALLGRNGAGKSTLINIIMQRTAYNGKILIDGKNVRDNDLLMQSLFCMNDTTFYPSWMRLSDVFSITDAMYMDFDLDYAKKLAADLDINLKKRIKQLSTGQRTLYKVILGLASNAAFVFLDEPVLGIDVNLRDTVYRLLAHKMSEQRSAFIICTHLIEEIENLIEDVVIIHDANMILNMPADEIRTRYRSFAGNAADIDNCFRGMDVIGAEQLPSYKKVIVNTDGTDIILPPDITEEPLSVQEIFYHLTGGAPAGTK